MFGEASKRTDTDDTTPEANPVADLPTGTPLDGAANFLDTDPEPVPIEPFVATDYEPYEL